MKSYINNRKIARNTLMLYVRMLLTIAIQLYTVPKLLRALGAEDYGLYHVIGSLLAIVSIVSFIASGSQRFFAFAIGEGNKDRLQSLFNTSRTVYLIITAGVFVFLEIAGLWFIDNKMQIPEGRYHAALWVFHLSTIGFCIRILSTPYEALIVAHEKLDFYAYTGILSAFIKLAAVYSLRYVNWDLLIYYSIAALLIQIIERGAYQFYCFYHFPESRQMTLHLDKDQGKDLLVYSGYNMIGALAIILRKQGTNIIMNIFFGTILNAAHAIATQIGSVLEQLVNNLYNASRPQITKTYATGNLAGMWKLVYRTSLLSYYLVMVISIVAFFELPSILQLWLHNVPIYTILIARIVIVCLMIETMINQLISVFQAMNKIKPLQMATSVILLLNVPVAYILLSYDNTKVIYPYLVQLAFSVIYVISIIVAARVVVNLNVGYFLGIILLRELLITLIVTTAAFAIYVCIAPSSYRIFLTALVVVTLSLFLISLFGFEKTDLELIKSKITNKLFRSH